MIWGVTLPENNIPLDPKNHGKMDENMKVLSPKNMGYDRYDP